MEANLERIDLYKIALSNPNYLKPIEGSSSYNEISASMRAPIETIDAEIKIVILEE